jgi:hypothetical protein
LGLSLSSGALLAPLPNLGMNVASKEILRIRLKFHRNESKFLLDEIKYLHAQLSKM